MTGDALPRLMVLDDREGLVRSALGTAALGDREPLSAVADDALGRVLGAPT